MDAGGLISQVKRNCHISDARFWGFYSVCGLLLRLRELYCFENGMMPWQRIEDRDISLWIERREALWKEMEEMDFFPIMAGGSEFQPFDARGINKIIMDDGLIYGAGYGLYMKPSFFLAGLSGRTVMDGFDVYVSGREYARDLSTHPAMLQGRAIFARKETAKLLVWERYEDFRARTLRGGGGALSVAFAHYGITGCDYAPEKLDSLFEAIAESEINAYIRHELGEAHEGMRLGREWQALLGDTAGGRASFYVRAVKDVLADTAETGMLKYIINEKNAGSFAFYIVSLSGYRMLLSGEIQGAFRRFGIDGDWHAVDASRASCYEALKIRAEEMLALYRAEKGNPLLCREIEKRFISNLKGT
jgi:hypothetical protein